MIAVKIRHLNVIIFPDRQAPVFEPSAGTD